MHADWVDRVLEAAMPREVLPPLNHARIELANAVRLFGNDSVQARTARQRLAAVTYRDRIQRDLSRAPELTAQQVSEIASMLRSTARELLVAS